MKIKFKGQLNLKKKIYLLMDESEKLCNNSLKENRDTFLKSESSDIKGRFMNYMFTQVEVSVSCKYKLDELKELLSNNKEVFYKSEKTILSFIESCKDLLLYYEEKVKEDFTNTFKI